MMAPRKHSTSLGVACLLLSLSGQGVGNSFERVALPFLETYCHTCHGGESVKAELDLKEIQDDSKILQDFQMWRNVLQQVNSGEMPPRRAQAKPTAEEIVSFREAIQASLAAAEAALQPDPGRVTMRRLNRTEYRHTVRDLLMVDYDPTESFPSDDIGHGFDNIGDVLTLPPLLLERYLDAAEGLAQRAIHLKLPRPPTRTTASIFLEPRGYRSENSTRALTNSPAELFVRHNIAEDGEYIFRVRAASKRREEADPPQMVLWVNDNKVQEFTVTNTLNDWQNFEVTLNLKAGSYRFRAELGNPPAPWGEEERQETSDTSESETPADLDAEEATDEPEPAEPPGPERMLYVREFKLIGPSDMRTDFMKQVGRVLGEEPFQWTGETIQVVSDRPSSESGEAEKALGRFESLAAMALESTNRERVVHWFLQRAFRRPPTESEVERYLGVLARGQEAANGSFEVGLQEMVMAALCSPKFLFRVELDERPTQEEPELLNDYQLASRLSYFLWNTMPDEALFELADRGELSAQLDAQVERMLKDPKAEALVNSFAMQWLQLQRLSTFQPDPSLFPGFDENLRQAMFRETELFLAEVMQENGNILDLITADYTYLNRRLARHYGVSDKVFNDPGDRRGRGRGQQDTEFVRVRFDEGERGGLLLQGSVLTVTSNPTRTSPVKRGKWVLEQILGTPPPPPPPGVEELEDQDELTGTLRERMEQHRANVACANCHQTMDAMGFAFENFDAIGRFRNKDGEEAIDASGELPDGRSFNGPAELKVVLSEKADLLARNITEKMLTYALGRGLEFYDERAVQAILKRLEADDFKFFSLVQGIVHSDPFRMRRGSAQVSAVETEEESNDEEG